VLLLCACAVLTLFQLQNARATAAAWANASAKASQTKLRDQAVLVLRDYVAKRPSDQPCAVQLLNTQQSAPFFAGFADVIVKSALQRDEPAFDCIVLTETAPWYQLLQNSARVPLSLRREREEFGRALKPRDLDGMTYLFLPTQLPKMMPADEVLVLHWHGETFLP
jgi:hypothetical protein